MSELFSMAPTLLLSALVGYVLGALPLAERISRWHGVDIFSAGTGLAGSSNVRRSVGKLPGIMVLVGDLGKGGAAVLGAELIGVDGPWVLVPIAAAVVGHWKSVFSRFRGGDGLATLGGATIAVFPILGIISVVVAMLVSLGAQRLPYSSLLSVVFGYTTLVGLVLALERDASLAVGVGGLGGLVLAYALIGHRRRRYAEWDEIEEAEGATEPSQLP